MIERPDEDHLRRATQNGRVLFSYNACDFCRIHREFLARGQTHAGLISAPQQRLSIGDQMRFILKLMASTSAEDMRNQLEFLANWR